MVSAPKLCIFEQTFSYEKYLVYKNLSSDIWYNRCSNNFCHVTPVNFWGYSLGENEILLVVLPISATREKGLKFANFWEMTPCLFRDCFFLVATYLMEVRIQEYFLALLNAYSQPTETLWKSL